ncbi:MAG: 30S ribosomal protein S20 [Rhodospirillaceae bacterium]|jgi:small subunit ribosomal protein S20|nr:30S ribosomal protein S20 [Rhodospirillaceae bacterium]MBT3928271.1 30S ribosomal protein S20 [Rhodospirillaceae bacterium]MBT4427561.1 30S ribosomal protein S20 [Rhodospirillaceae bacterium]MBT5039588.1 30S ribosomal protein S20 [Rhodospirillaceae bacterium]MBT5676272.1 30S ribosomal protein S20 [Rhodospirillaceae bacterium]
MAHTVQAKKRIRQLEKHTEINRRRMSRIRTFLRTVEHAIESGDKPAAQEALKAFQPEIMRGVTRGVLRKNTAARRMSRLNKRIKAIA